MKTKMNITQYAELIGVTRDTIHKRINRGGKLTGATFERVGKVYILTVDKDKAISAKS